MEVSSRYGAKVLERDANIASDVTTLDPVIYDAMVRYEEKVGQKFDIIITVQPTSPLLKRETLVKAIKKLIDNEDIDTVISVADDRHLAWTKDNEGRSIPKYEKRLNRQYLPSEFRETGAILAVKRRAIKEDTRIGKVVDLVEVDRSESIDIDTYEDWWIAEKLLKKKKIVIRVDAEPLIGTGHIYRQLNVASRIVDHEVVFLMDENKELGINIVKSFNFPVITFNEDCFEKLNELKPDIVINDILDTDREYMNKLKDNGIFTVNFEDMGEGAKIANIVFNALYEYKLPLKNIYGGYKYYILRDEFKDFKNKEIKKDVSKVLITFGGTDPNNFTEKIADILNEYYPNIKVDIILGLGYKDKDRIKEKYFGKENISIYESVRNISNYMYNSDIVITSGGRTMYEVASLGVPCLVLCQNERELTHLFGHSGNGIVNLGLGEHLTEGMIKNTISELIDNYELRCDMNEKMKMKDLRHGFENITDIVEKQYLKFKENNK